MVEAAGIEAYPFFRVFAYPRINIRDFACHAFGSYAKKRIKTHFSSHELSGFCCSYPDFIDWLFVLRYAMLISYVKFFIRVDLWFFTNNDIPIFHNSFNLQGFEDMDYPQDLLSLYFPFI